MWGPVGERWIRNLPRTVDVMANVWDLEVGDTFDLSFQWVARATCSDGTPAVLKLGPPEPGHMADEAAALDAFDGQGAVRLLRHDHERGALLLERAEPGDPATDLVATSDEDATATAIAVLRRLHTPPPNGCRLPDLASQGAHFAAHLRDHPGSGPMPRHLVELAAGLFGDLCASATETVVLHGDLHHDNVLRATREPWLAIDPHGRVGDPVSDVGAWTYNPIRRWEEDRVVSYVQTRLEQMAEGLGYGFDRVVAWAYVTAVLSEVWCCEDGGVPGGRALAVAQLLDPQVRRLTG